MGKAALSQGFRGEPRFFFFFDHFSGGVQFFTQNFKLFFKRMR
jgi:hypothetical protein